MENMKEPIAQALRTLDEAYAIVSSLRVSGDAVDEIAAVRAKMRRVAAALKGIHDTEGDAEHG